MAFRLNTVERAILESRYYDEKRAAGQSISTDSAQRAVRRIQEGSSPRTAPETASYAKELFATDGLTLTNPNVPEDAYEDGEEEETVDDTAEDAFSAREIAEEILDEGVRNASALDRAARLGQQPAKKESKTVYKVYVTQVRIERVNAGEQLDYYDAYTSGKEVSRTARKGQEFYAIYVTRLYVKE